MSSRLDERGSVTLFFCVFVVALLAAAGLVVDGGSALRAIVQAQSAADSAARAGAQQVDLTALRGGRLLLDERSAVATAQQSLRAAGATGTASASGTTVTTTATASRRTVFLGMVGVDSVTATRTSRAELQTRP